MQATGISADVSVPTNSRVYFTGAVTGTGTERMEIAGANVRLFGPVLHGVDLAFGVDCDGAWVTNLVSVGAEHGMVFDTYGQLFQSRAKNITVTNSTIAGSTGVAVQINGCENVTIDGCVVEADCADGWANYGSRDLTVRRLWLKGQYPAGIRNISFRSVSGALGFVRTKYFGSTVEDFYDADNSEGEGISFDCHGSSAADTSAVKTTTVASKTSTGVTPASNVAAYGANDYVVRFQNGNLAGQAFVVTYSGADGLQPWDLGDGWSSVHAQATVGDVITLELDCRDNLIEDCTVKCVSGPTRASMHAVMVYGMSGVTVRRPILEGVGLRSPDVHTQSLRGIQGAGQDYCVANDVTVEGLVSTDSEVTFDAFAYGAFALPYSYGNSVVDSSAHQLHLVRQPGFAKTNSTFVLADDAS